jgi:hypothetical protein
LLRCQEGTQMQQQQQQLRQRQTWSTDIHDTVPGLWESAMMRVLLFVQLQP